MDINQLKYFISVAQTLNFSEAARRNGLTQPSISHHIGELEKQLEAQLFVRDKRSVTLTDAGRAFLPNALEIVELAQKSALQLKEMESGKSGHISIAALTTASVILSRCLAAFSAAYPDITVDINFTSGRTQALIMNEARYDVHFAMSEMVPAGESFAVLPAGEDRLCLALPAGHPLCGEFAENGVNLSLLRDQRFIACSQNDGPALYRQIMEVCAARGYAPNITCQYDRAEAVLLSVGAGLGVSIVPEVLSHVFYADNVVCFPIPGDDTLRSYVVAWHKPITSPAVRRFAEIAAGLFPAGERSPGETVKK